MLGGDYGYSMKVAHKSPKSRPKHLAVKRSTLTLPRDAYDTIDLLRGEVPRSVFVQRLIEREKTQIERDAFVASVNAAYTPEVVRRTLKVNAAFPIHEG